MDFKSFIPESISDRSWLESYEAKMGEKELMSYKNKVYHFLNELKVGQSINVEDWCAPKSYDLFMKIAFCFMLEQNGEYRFENGYKIITHKYNAEEVERIDRTCREIIERRKRFRADIDAAQLAEGGSQAIPSPEPEIQSSKKG